ncbi:MAG: glycosyltransferase family 4 protein [Taibaiella sp.]|nr:glycosyltransferase family 4 protein [Taibaiella sp.]
MDYIYLLLIVILSFGTALWYFRIADKYDIIDKPNERSSHTTITIRGGGVIFPIAVILYCVFFQPFSYDFTGTVSLVLGLVAISVVSFWDDVSSLPNKVRISVHLISVSLLLYSLNAFSLLPWYGIIVAYILIIGTINAYNFMDGINGITGLYSLVILLSVLYYNHFISAFTNEHFILTGVIACLVFLFFNFRKKARCFAGDVGSVSIGYLVLFFILGMIITGELKYVFFLAVYGVDAVLTIFHRLFLRQNIFQAHRLHFYQILANEQKLPHLTVAIIYAMLQLIINIVIIHTKYDFIATGLIVCLPLAFIYVILKPRLMKQKAT